MKDIYIDIRGLEVRELFPKQDLVSLEEFIDVMEGIYIDNKNKDDEIKELKEYKDENCDKIDNNPYSYYGVSENDFH